MTPAAPAVATGLSIGTIALAQDSVDKLSTHDHRYKVDKSIIEDAIKESDWQILEDMLDSRTSDFPDLIQMIKEALNNKK